MIRLVEREAFPGCFGEEAFGARIVSNAEQYGGYPFFEAWTQEQDGVITAAIGKLDTALMVTVSGDADYAELREFLGMVAYGSVLGEGSVIERLGLTGPRGPVLYRQNTNPAQTAPNLYAPVPLREIHELLKLCETETFQVPEWEPFYLDLSHRLRHGGAQVETLFEGDTLAACAMTVAQTPQLAVVGAVAVHPAFRRGGLGRTVVNQLTAHLTQPETAVLSTEPEFYEKMGFERRGTWVQTAR